MEMPRELQAVADERPDAVIRRYDYDGKTVIAVDFGPGVHPSVDVVGDTAIIVVGDQQFEFELPADASDITVNDGILTIEE